VLEFADSCPDWPPHQTCDTLRIVRSRASTAWLATHPARLLAVLAMLAGCEPDDEGVPSCIEFDVEACTPQYPPQFDRVFTETLRPSCGAAGGACHGSSSAAGAERGLHISDLDATHAALLGQDGGIPFVIPGDPACSLLMVRMNVSDSSRLMPPGQDPLPQSVRCSVARWIAEGAAR
jgi:hypothetical protein